MEDQASSENGNIPKSQSLGDTKNSNQNEDANQVNLEILEDATTEPVYRMRPALKDKFKPLSAKEIIHDVLFDQLSSKVYNAAEAQGWCKDIADIIRGKIKELRFQRYKYIIDVIMGEQHGAGVKMGTRCIWDAEADTYAYDAFINDTLFCVATVYAVYYY